MTTVTIALFGGIGNQMFQYAMGRALAIRHNASLQLDLYGFEFDTAYGRQFELSRFNIGSHLTTTSRPLAFRLSRILRRLAASAPMMARLAPPSIVVESSAQFNPAHFRINCEQNAYVMGYWQDERYFSDCSETIRHEFTLANGFSNDNAKIAELIGSTPTPVAIHVRRLHDVIGTPDVEKMATAERGGFVLPIEYYLDALREIEERVTNPFYFVFSDYPEWAQDRFGKNDSAVFLGKGRGPDYEDMVLMSLCKHHIIANSSFSWWGAWLAANDDQVVIAPRSANRHMSIIPESWIRV